MIAGGLLIEGERECSAGYVQDVFQERDFNNDGQVDELKAGHCEGDEAPKHPQPSLMIAGHGQAGLTFNPSISNDKLTIFHLADDWKLKMATDGKNVPVYGIGDEVMTPLGDKARIQSFSIYLDENWNVVQRTAAVLAEEENVTSDAFDLSDLVLLSPVADLNMAGTAIAELTKIRFEEEIRRVKEIFSYADYRCLKEGPRREVDQLSKQISSHIKSYIDEPAEGRDWVAKKYLRECVKAELKLPFLRLE